MRPDLEDLPRRRRRRLLLRAVLRPVLTAACLVVAYYRLPLARPYTDRTLAGLSIGLLLVTGLLVWQTRSITRARYPRLRAIEALATSFPLFILLFATAYFLMESSQPASLTQPLTRTDALYFTITVFSTVGFGDIAPRSENARIVVIWQMLGDLLLVGVAARVLLDAVRAGLGRRGISPPSGGSGQAPGADRPGEPPDQGLGPLE